MIKISPDINDSQISGLIELINKYNIQGIVVSNTTDKNRENLLDDEKGMKKVVYLDYLLKTSLQI